MSFIVKYRSKTAGGREIVRPNEVDKDELSVGRGANCDVLLTDLGVAPHHAKITRTGAAQIAIEGEKSFPLLINGRSRTSGDINATRGGSIRIGPHLLSIAMGQDEEQGRIVITVDRDEEIDKEEADKLFGLGGKVPGKRISAWGFVALILIACLAWPIWSYYEYRNVDERPEGFHADTLWISGSMSDAHANLAEDCQSCHVEPFVSVRDSACIECHTDVADHAELDLMVEAEPDPGAWRGFLLTVGDAFNRPRNSCASCHIEHEGSGAMAPAPQQFCSDCHTGLDDRIETDLANVHDFASGHPEFRPRIMTTPGDISGGTARYVRTSLSSNDLSENTGLKFPHDLHLSTTNGVARMTQRLAARYGWGDSLDCADCHVPTSDGARFEPISMEANCQMCHSLAFDRIGGTVRTLRHGEPEMVVADIRAFYRSTGARRPIDLSGMSRRRPGDNMRSRTVGRFQFAQSTRYSGAERAVRATFSEGGACFDCHQVQPTGSSQAPFDIVPVRQISRYMHGGWFDHRAHETEDCESCHVASESDSARDVLLPGIETCRDCHGGANAGGDLVASSCALCHSYHQDDGAPYLVRARQNRGIRPNTVRDFSGLWNRDRADR